MPDIQYRFLKTYGAYERINFIEAEIVSADNYGNYEFYLVGSTDAVRLSESVRTTAAVAVTFFQECAINIPETLEYFAVGYPDGQLVLALVDHLCQVAAPIVHLARIIAKLDEVFSPVGEAYALRTEPSGADGVLQLSVIAGSDPDNPAMPSLIGNGVYVLVTKEEYEQIVSLGHEYTDSMHPSGVISAYTITPARLRAIVEGLCVLSA